MLEKCLSQNENTERLIARQMKLEEDREARERRRDKKEEESLATWKGIKPPSFKGNSGDRPEAHILRAEDWMDASNPDMTDAAKVKNFRLILDHHAREWYDKADCKTSWKKMKLEFNRYFSTQGRSMRNLFSRWKELKFEPQKDDIEEFVRDVQETGKQLNHGEEAIANMIKSSMPMAMYTSLYDEENLEKIIKKMRDIYAKTPNMDKDRCLKCNEFGHWAKDCPQNQNGAQQKTFPGAQYNYMYPMVPPVPMAPVAMPSNGIQVPMQGPNTAALGQMTDVMMQLNEVEL